MLTPLDIENKAFSKSMRGYNVDEVDEFLDQIIVDLQNIMAENSNLEKKNKRLEEELYNFKQSETSMLSTIESAQKLMTDISESVEKRAEVIIKNAHLDAEVIQRDAKESVARLAEENRQMKQKLKRMKDRYRQMLEDELKSLDNDSMGFLDELEKEFIPASMTENTQEPVREETRKKEESTSRDTIVVGEKAIEEMLMEDFSNIGDSIPLDSNDRKKTIIL